jgi:hypothetical protein
MLIHMQNRIRLAASGALVAVKHRAMEPVKKVKVFPVCTGCTRSSRKLGVGYDDSKQ